MPDRLDDEAVERAALEQIARDHAAAQQADLEEQVANEEPAGTDLGRAAAVIEEQRGLIEAYKVEIAAHEARAQEADAGIAELTTQVRSVAFLRTRLDAANTRIAELDATITAQEAAHREREASWLGGVQPAATSGGGDTMTDSYAVADAEEIGPEALALLQADARANGRSVAESIVARFGDG